MAAPRDSHMASGVAALYEVGRRLASTHDLGTLLSQIAEVTKRLVDYQTFAIFLLDPAGKHLVPRYAVGFRELYVEAVLHISVGEGLVGQAALRQELIWIPDVHQDPRYVRRITDAGEEIRCELVIPLIYHGETVGVLDVGSIRPAQFSEEDLAFLKTLGTQVAGSMKATAVGLGAGGGAQPTPVEAATQPPAETPTPQPTAPPPATATPQGCPSPYTVKQGDWIYKIARDCKVEPSAIVAANPGINPNLIKPGQQLNMPVAGATAVPPATPQACTGTHTVVRGENLFRIAYNCGLTTEQLARANGIAFPYTIHPGDVIRFP